MSIQIAASWSDSPLRDRLSNRMAGEVFHKRFSLGAGQSLELGVLALGDDRQPDLVDREVVDLEQAKHLLGGLHPFPHESPARQNEWQANRHEQDSGDPERSFVH